MVVQKLRDTKQITAAEINIQIHMIIKLTGIIQMSILCRAHQSIIQMVRLNLSNM